MKDLTYDLRIAVRALARTPLLTAAIIASLAISIGAVTTVFSVVNSVLVRALPFRNEAQLVWMSSLRPRRSDAPFTLPEFADYAAQSRTVELAAYTTWNAAMETKGTALRLQGLRLSANAFDVLGAFPTVGRLLRPNDDSSKAAHVVVLGYGFWQTQFGADRGVVGQTLRLNGEAYTVVGVLPRYFPLPIRNAEVVVPLSPDLDPRRNLRGSTNFLRIFGRLRSATLAAAQREMSGLADDLKSRFPTEYATKLGVRLVPYHDYLVGSSRQILTLLFGAAVLLLAIALANVLNLLLIRGVARRGEIALRRALGATPLHLAIGLGSEAALLAAAGSVVGIVMSRATVAVIAASSIDVPRLDETRVDWHTLAFVIVVAALATALFSIVPMLAAWRSAPGTALAALGRGQHGARGQNRTRSMFLVAQLSFAVLLVALSATMVTSLARLERVELGYRPDSTLVARVTLPPTKYRSVADVVRFTRELEAALRASPGVIGAGAISVAPLSGILYSVPFTIPGRAPSEHRDQPNANIRAVSPGYFESIRASLARGRFFDDRDNETGQHVAVVSQAFAERYFAGVDPVGREFLVDDNNHGPRPLAIIGVSRDMRQIDLDGPPSLDIFIPMGQIHADGLGFVTGSQFWTLRVATAMAGGSTIFARAIGRVDPEVAVARVRPMGDYVGEVLASRKVSVATLLGFASVALLLAAIGVYSVTAYSVEQRRREIGLRMALGASRGDMARHVIRPAIAIASIGVAIGIAGAVTARQVVAGLLFGVTPTDPLLLTSVGGLLIVISAVAAAIPARRATQIDPAIALAGE